MVFKKSRWIWAIGLVSLLAACAASEDFYQMESTPKDKEISSHAPKLEDLLVKPKRLMVSVELPAGSWLVALKIALKNSGIEPVVDFGKFNSLAKPHGEWLGFLVLQKPLSSGNFPRASQSQPIVFGLFGQDGKILAKQTIRLKEDDVLENTRILAPYIWQHFPPQGVVIKLLGQKKWALVSMGAKDGLAKGQEVLLKPDATSSQTDFAWEPYPFKGGPFNQDWSIRMKVVEVGDEKSYLEWQTGDLSSLKLGDLAVLYFVD